MRAIHDSSAVAGDDTLEKRDFTDTLYGPFATHVGYIGLFGSLFSNMIIKSCLFRLQKFEYHKLLQERQELEKEADELRVRLREFQHVSCNLMPNGDISFVVAIKFSALYEREKMMLLARDVIWEAVLQRQCRRAGILCLGPVVLNFLTRKCRLWN